MLKQYRPIREMANSDFGIRKLTNEELDLQKKFMKKKKVSLIVPKSRANEKISKKYKKVVI